MNVRLLLAGIAALAMSACAGVADVIQKREALYQPASIHSATEHPARNAYREALSIARAANSARLGAALASSTPAELIDSGIGAVNSNCRAWFAAVSAASLRVQQGETNVSVLQALMTGVLAAWGVHSDVMLAYGLGTAAYAGYMQGFMSNVLFMADYPTQTKVREAMAERARALRAQQTMTFVQAYDALEDYEQICMPQAAKELARASMSAVTTTVAPAGTITVAPAPAASVTSSYQKDDSGTRILAYWMPAGQVDKPNEVRLHAWMGERGIFASLPFFSHAKIYEAARKQLVDELKLPEAK